MKAETKEKVRLSSKQKEALRDANEHPLGLAQSEVNLNSFSWCGNNGEYSDRTVQSLFDKGLLHREDREAHITKLGESTL